MRLLSDAPVYMDILLLACMSLAWGASCWGIAVRRSSIGMWLVQFGWLGLVIRTVYGLVETGSLTIATASVAPMTFLSAGTVLLALEQAKRLRSN